MTRRAPTAEELANIGVLVAAAQAGTLPLAGSYAECTLALLDDYTAAMKVVEAARVIAMDDMDWPRARLADAVRDFDRGRS